MPRTADPITGNDDIMVNILMSGRPYLGKPTKADLVEAARRLARDGYSDGQIAHLLDRSRREVLRLRKATGTPAALDRHHSNQRFLNHPTPSRPYHRG